MTKTIVIMASITMASVFAQKLLIVGGETDKASVLNIFTMGGLITTAATAVTSAIVAISKFGG